MEKEYPAYKDTGIEWIGEVPEHWEIKRLKFIANINPSKSNIVADSSEDIVTFIPMENVGEDGSVDYSIKKKLAEVNNGYTNFEKDDVLVAKITPCFENGKGTFLSDLDTRIGFGSTEFHVIRPTIKTMGKFLFYVTRTRIFNQRGEAQMLGAAGQKRVPTAFIENYTIGLPPQVEQTAIAQYLDQKTDLIDQTIAKKEKLIALLEEERKALINEAVTKGIDPNAPLKPSGINWLGDIPGHWEVKKLKYLVNLVNEKAEPELMKIALENIESGTGKLINISEENKYEGEFKKFIKDDVLFNKLRPYLEKVYLSEFEGACVGELLVWRCGRLLEPNFLFYRAISCSFIEVVNNSTYGAKMPRASWDFIGNLMIPVPPIDEQARIFQYIQSEIYRIQQTTVSIQKEIELLKEYRQALIFEVVTGKIDVRDAVAERVP